MDDIISLIDIVIAMMDQQMVQTHALPMKFTKGFGTQFPAGCDPKCKKARLFDVWSSCSAKQERQSKKSRSMHPTDFYSDMHNGFEWDGEAGEKQQWHTPEKQQWNWQ